MKKNLILFLLIVLATLVSPGLPVKLAFAQPEINLSRVQVSLLPEQEPEAMFVIYDIELDSGIPLPIDLSFQIPEDAESLMVSIDIGDSQTTTVEPEVSTEDNWQDIRFSTTSPRIQIQYLDPNLTISDAQRTFSFSWLPRYPVNSLSIQILAPVEAGDLITDLPSFKRGEDQEGFHNYSADVGAVSANKRFAFELSYTVDSDNLATALVKVSPMMPVNQATPGRAPSPLSVVMWLIAVSLTVLVLVAFYYWWFQINIQGKRDRMVQGVVIMNPAREVVFCHECGMRSRPGDVYCSNCGTELRTLVQTDRYSYG